MPNTTGVVCSLNIVIGDGTTLKNYKAVLLNYYLYHKRNILVGTVYFKMGTNGDVFIVPDK